MIMVTCMGYIMGRILLNSLRLFVWVIQPGGDTCPAEHVGLVNPKYSAN